MKRCRIVLKIFLSLAVLLVLLAAAAWFCPEQILTVDSGPVKADAMVVLGGGAYDRAERAAGLFKEGEAPLVICSGYGDDRSVKTHLVKDGVPARDIMLEAKSRTTRENAEFSVALLRSLGARRVIIVTSWYHSRRALACFEHYASNMQFYSRPSYFGYVGEPPGAGNEDLGAGSAESKAESAEDMRAERRAEWKRVRGYADAEYVKLLGYWMCYGVCPF